MKNTLAVQPSVETISVRIAPLRDRLANHPLYSKIQTPRQLQTFMESHVFAVWDFMSLLKALQIHLTCVTLPWKPTRWPESRRFINEIVLGEESDLYEGRAISHFELYLEAMQEAGADTDQIETLLKSISTNDGGGIQQLPDLSTLDSIPDPARNFVLSTFETMQANRLPAIAAAFTFGREDIIPDIFRNLVRDLDSQNDGRFQKFLWYLERHIEVDGENHGPLSLRMITDLCGDDEALWEEAALAAETALTARIALWDGIIALL